MASDAAEEGHTVRRLGIQPTQGFPSFCSPARGKICSRSDRMRGPSRRAGSSEEDVAGGGRVATTLTPAARPPGGRTAYRVETPAACRAGVKSINVQLLLLAGTSLVFASGDNFSAVPELSNTFRTSPADFSGTSCHQRRAAQKPLALRVQVIDYTTIQRVQVVQQIPTTIDAPLSHNPSPASSNRRASNGNSTQTATSTAVFESWINWRPVNKCFAI